jgi:hypothetical protein
MIMFLMFYFHVTANAQWRSSESNDSSSQNLARNPLMSPEEQKYLQMARKRVYPGGSDEESLKVQAQLPVPTRKMAPATEAPEESDSGSSSGDD